MQKIIVPLLFLSCVLTAQVYPSEQDNRERIHYELRMSGALPMGDDGGDDYLFNRDHFLECFNPRPIEHDVSLSEQTANQLTMTPPVTMNRNKLHVFDEVGTCSAMSLDFLARSITHITDLDDPNSCREKIASFAPYYICNTTTFLSRQAAFNAIELNPPSASWHDIFNDQYKLAKVQTLASLHGLTLTAATSTIQTKELHENPDFFIEMVDTLPDGFYFVRMLRVKETSPKKEAYGHSMTFLKRQGFSVYYDNSDGAVEITDKVGRYVVKKLSDWSIPEFRLYFAEGPQGGALNLSEQTFYSYSRQGPSPQE